MSALILLSAAEADAVRGPSGADPMSALEPVALTDGRFTLGIEVLDDPAHAAHRDVLAALPRADLAEISGLLPTSEI